MHITVVKIELTSWINDFLSILPGQRRIYVVEASPDVAVLRVMFV